MPPLDLLVRWARKSLFRLEVLVTLAWARFLVSRFPFWMWRARLGPLGQSADEAQSPGVTQVQCKQAKDIGRIVADVARHAPFEALCLPQAMAARWVLARRNLASRIILGSRQGELGDGPQFHAWLMVGDTVVTGERERAAFLQFHKTPRGVDVA